MLPVGSMQGDEGFDPLNAMSNSKNRLILIIMVVVVLLITISYLLTRFSKIGKIYPISKNGESD